MKWKIGTLLVVGVATVTVGLSLFVTGYWSTEISESSGAVAAVSESEGGGLHDGIKAHGEYEIEVRDPDGTLVAKRAVPNTVTASGKSRIAQALFGGGAPSVWMLRLLGTPAPCTGGPSACVMTFGNATYTTHSPTQQTLSKTLAGRTIVFSASYLASVPSNSSAAGGKITGVDLHPTKPPANMNYTFSSATVSPGVAYTKGQTINVTYTISIN